MRPVYSTVTGNGSGPVEGEWIPVDYIQAPFNVGLGCELLSGAGSYDVEVTFDDVFDPTVTPSSITSTEITGKSADFYASLTVPVRAVRLSVDGAAVVKLTVLQGLSA